jgi:ketosteroid isomerase-like protein
MALRVKLAPAQWLLAGLRILVAQLEPVAYGAQTIKQNYGGRAVRTTLAIILATSTIFLSPASAAAADTTVKQEVEKIASAYAESFNRQDASGIAALFASGGVLVNPTGLHADIEQFVQGAFKAGFDRLEITVNEVWPLGIDAALAMGEFRQTGKNQSGAPIENAGLWTATDVREDGHWKIRMLTGMPKAQPAPK